MTTNILNSQTNFQQLSEYLLSGVVIETNDKKYYRIAEIEFYLYNPSQHPDIFVHRDKEQLENSTWYHHKQNGKSYKEGTYKGLDITFGNGKDVYGGILIRSLLEIGGLDNLTKTIKVIEGPSLCVDQLIGGISVKTFMEKCQDNNVCSREEFHLLELNSQQQEELKKIVLPFSESPRVGLRLNKSYFDERCRYLLKPYRIIAGDHKCKKQAITIGLQESESKFQKMSKEEILDVKYNKAGYQDIANYLAKKNE